MSMSLSLAYSISSSLESISHSLRGAIIFSPGASAIAVTSNLTWSFPLPVQPWAMAAAFSFLATSTRPFAIIGLDSAVASKYFDS